MDHSANSLYSTISSGLIVNPAEFTTGPTFTAGQTFTSFGSPIIVPSVTASKGEVFVTEVKEDSGNEDVVVYIGVQTGVQTGAPSEVTAPPNNRIVLKTGASITEDGSTFTLPPTPTTITSSATWMYGTVGQVGTLEILVMADDSNTIVT